MIQYSHYDKAVIVTGDGDFSCLVDYLRQKSKLRILLAPNMRRYSALLKPAAAQQIAFISRRFTFEMHHLGFGTTLFAPVSSAPHQ